MQDFSVWVPNPEEGHLSSDLPCTTSKWVDCWQSKACEETGDIARGKSKPAVWTLSGFGMEINLTQHKISKNRDEPRHSMKLLLLQMLHCVRGNADSPQSLIIWIQMVGSPRGCAHFLKSANPQNNHSQAFPCLKHQDVLSGKATTPWLLCLQRYFLLSHKSDCALTEKLNYYLPWDSSSPWWSRKISISSLHLHTFLDLTIEKVLETYNSQADAFIRQLALQQVSHFWDMWEHYSI